VPNLVHSLPECAAHAVPEWLQIGIIYGSPFDRVLVDEVEQKIRSEAKLDD
jgi:hypothetical protein